MKTFKVCNIIICLVAGFGVNVFAADTAMAVTPLALPVNVTASAAVPEGLTPVTAAVKTAAASVPGSITKEAEIQATALPVTPAAQSAVNLYDAIKKVVDSNAAVKAALADVNKAKALLEKEKGVYDPYIKTGVSYAESADKSTTLQDPKSEKIFIYSAGLGSKLITGGDIKLDFVSSRTALLFQPYSGSVDASLFRSSINPNYYPELILSYTQPLLKDFWGDPAGEKIQAQEYRYKSARENLRETVISCMFDLKYDYYEFYLRDIYLKAGRNYAKDAENTYAAVKASGRGEAELLQAKAASIVAGAGIKLLEKDYAKAREKYLSAAGYAPADWAAVVVEADETTEEAYVPQEMTDDLENTLVELQPAVTAQKFSLLAQEAIMTAAKNSVLPGLNLTAGFGLNGFSENFGSALDDLSSGKFGDFMIGADFSFSLPNRTGTGAADAEAELANKTRAIYEDTQNIYRIKIRSAYSGITAQKDFYTAAKEARQLYERRVKLLQQAYSQAGGSARDVLLAHQDRYNARKNEADAFVAYAKAIMAWNRVNGKYDYFFNEFYKSKIIINN